MRSGIRNVSEANLWDAETGEYLTAGKVALPQWWVGIGKLADLVVLTGDPLARISEIRTVERVLSGGAWVDVKKYRDEK